MPDGTPPSKWPARPNQAVEPRSYVAVVTAIGGIPLNPLHSQLLGIEQSHIPGLVPRRSETAEGERICRKGHYGAPARLWHDHVACEQDCYSAAPGSFLCCWYLQHWRLRSCCARQNRCSDFDQSFYLTVAYDIVHHGVFSNGVFDNVNSTRETPPSGRFFGPVYPALVVAAMKVDSRFAHAVDCSVEANHQVRDGAQCEAYALPMHVIHAALLAIGVLASALAAEMIFVSVIAFWVAGSLATVALLADADLFSFVMTESVTFSLYSVAALSMIAALKTPRFWKILVVGCLFGLLALTRASYVVLALVVPVLFAVYYRWANAEWRQIAQHLAAFAIGWLAVVSPWLVRNAMSVGHWGLTEEYGSATLIERFAYNDMSAREFLLAFPYCLPEVGPPLTRRAFGPDRYGAVRLRNASQLFPCRPRSSRQVGRGPRPARSADRRYCWRGTEPQLVAPPVSQRPASLVRNVGRRLARARLDAPLRCSLCRREAPLEMAFLDLRGPCYRDARLARGRGQPIYPLQSHSDRPVFGRRRPG